MNLSVTFILLLSFLSLYDCNDAPQGCMDKQRVMGILRQMEKFLKGQEIRFTEGLRIMKSKLTNLQNSVSKFPQADQSLSQSSCPPLVAPANGRKFGSKYLLGHEVHFTCSQGFRLVGPVTRVCQENGTWSGATASCKDVSMCSSNPCQNGGTCVEALNKYKCTCPYNWSGSQCQYQTQTDVNECEVYKADRGGPLCVHACVNVPGSYHCSCPTGYKLLADGRSCEDVDECLTQQHNCSRGSTCINTGGGFQCVSPECPPAHANASYVKTSPLQCERNPCPMESRSCPLAAKTISYHYLSLPSNLRTPATLFRMATASAPGRPGPDSLRFGIASGGDSRSLFVMQRSDRQTGELILVQPLRGPQELSVEVEMSEYAERSFQAKHLARVTLLVSPYEF
ncbi:fibulin-7 isoform X3 [Danio rerio]|uniref:Fibulin-7 isoform X3 n=1 Tax=Danio rerio TaxID=7955 RepID=A0A8M3AZF9_DANRE|nr:fibulin-7 isoform X3 [Danio rerio]|eukprot:XP_009305868.1 fibulin-7 isoform X3 [Danio rerio]